MNNLYILGTLLLLTLVSSTTKDPLLFEATPAPQDQCQPVNASEPIECPAHVGPPCPYCYTNDQNDYTAGANLSFSRQDLDSIRSNMNQWIHYWESRYPPTRQEPAGDYSVFTGLSGRALVFLRLYLYTSNATFLSLSQQYNNAALKILPSKQQYASYFFGNIGVWTIAAILSNVTNDANGQQLYLGNIQKTFEDVNTAIMTGDPSLVSFSLDIEDIDEGLSGMLYAGMLLNRWFGNDELIDPNAMKNISYFIISTGMANGQMFGHDWMMFENPNLQGCYDWGMGHGSGGVMRMLLLFSEKYAPELLSDDKYFIPMKNTLDNLVSVQLPDGNMPTDINGSCAEEYGNDTDARVQWCHGAPGFTDLFTYASYIFQSINATAAKVYLQSGLRASNVTWTRGLIVKGLMYCHGIGGNTYMLWRMSENMKKMGNMEFYANQAAWRAKQFILWTLNDQNTNHLRCEYSDENYSMFQGCPGIVMLYVQALQNGWPGSVEACMPGWNLCV